MAIVFRPSILRRSVLRRIQAETQGLQGGRISPAAWAIAVYVFLLVSRVPELLPVLRLGAVAALAAVILVARLPYRPLRQIVRGTEMRIVLGLWMLALFSVPLSYWPGQSFVFLVAFTKIVLTFGLILYGVRSARETGLVVASVVAAALALEIQFFVAGGEGKSVTATYDRNDLAFILTCIVPIAVLALPRRPSLRIAAGLIALLGAAVAVMTLSRGGFVTLLVATVMIVIRVPSRHLGAMLVVLAAAALGLALFASETYWTRVATIWGGADAGQVSAYDAEGLDGRWEIWKRGVTMMLQHPFLGVGGGAFDTAEGITRGTPGKWFAAHSAYLQVGAELGVAGLGLFLFLLYRGLRNCRRAARMFGRRLPDRAPLARGLEASLWVFAVGALALSMAYAHLLYVIIAVSVVLRRTATVAKP
jgi:O-antigen ligase